MVCSTDTCLNGATCRQTAATMVECLCATGFTGPTCSLRMFGLCFFDNKLGTEIKYFRWFLCQFSM